MPIVQLNIVSILIGFVIALVPLFSVEIYRQWKIENHEIIRNIDAVIVWIDLIETQYSIWKDLIAPLKNKRDVSSEIAQKLDQILNQIPEDYVKVYRFFKEDTSEDIRNYIKKLNILALSRTHKELVSDFYKEIDELNITGTRIKGKLLDKKDDLKLKPYILRKLKK